MAYIGAVRPRAREDLPSDVNRENPVWAGIIETADALGVPAAELATIISYETGGTMDAMQRGPVTQWGQHRGFIQFGEPQAAEYGVDFTDQNTAITSQLGKDGAIVKYALAHGFKPGMSALDLYSTINAGAPGRYDASDAANGGAAGSVAEKYYGMDDHRKKVYRMMGAEPPAWFNNNTPAFGDEPAAATAVPETPTKGDKMYDGWSYFAKALDRGNEPMVTRSNTTGVELDVPMQAIPEL